MGRAKEKPDDITKKELGGDGYSESTREDKRGHLMTLDSYLAKAGCKTRRMFSLVLSR